MIDTLSVFITLGHFFKYWFNIKSFGILYCKRIFNAELNIEPSPETKAVYERVLSEL